MDDKGYSLQESFDYFRSQSNLSSASLETYSYAMKHFVDFLKHSDMAQPLSLAGERPLEQPLSNLGSSRHDVNLLSWFVNYLGREVQPAHTRPSHEPKRLEPATVRLYGQALITWLRFLADELLLPDRFPASAAISQAHRRLRTYIPATEARDGAPEPPRGIEELIHAHDHPDIPTDVSPKEKRLRKLAALRNRALLYALADSGGRVSEILRIRAEDVRGAKVNPQGIWQVRVRGKGRGRYGRRVTLRFTRPTLAALRDYLEARQDPGATSLFVSHALTRPKYRNTPMSPNAVWRMIHRSTRKLGLPHIRPHDFRHWRATQMLKRGVPIDQVQRFLNHRSIRTTQLYAKTAEKQVDQAGARTSPFTNQDDES
jgi:integrase